jgi:autophagy-related protein 2
MVTWSPDQKVNLANEIVNDESEAVLRLLPLRCVLDQKAIRFATAFFRPDQAKETPLPKGLYAVPPPKIRLFRVKPFRLKVDYTPQKMDRQALRDGQIVELINISPLHGMVLTLQQVEVTDKIGFGEVVLVLVRSWIGDICSTQIIKFLTNAQPFEPITNITGGISDLIVLPWEALQNGDSIQRSLRSGAKSFTQAITYETLTISSRLAEFMASHTATAFGSGARPILPSRPLETPRGMTDTATHGLESIARGFQEANFKVVIIPYREYQRHGTTGALKSVLRGIPVALAAPASGAVEALSFTLLGARNQLRPDIRKEEEVNQRGLRYDA